MVTPQQPTRRLAAIDQFRGFAILTMALANYLAGVIWIPAWLKHAPDVGLTFTDLIAPFFIFSIGLTYALSIRRRAGRDGWAAAYRHATGRYLAVLGIGALLSAGQIALNIDTNGVAWGVLQAIGVAGLLTLAVIRLPLWVRAATGLGLLALYQILLEAGWKALVLAAPHGGIHGAVSWSAMLILATVLADLFHAGAGKRWAFWGAAALALGLGLLLATWFPISKNRVSPAYVLVSLGISGLLFGLFALWGARLARPLALLAAWGKNPILLYVLHLLLLGIIVLPESAAWYALAPGWLVGVQAAFLVAALSGVAWALRDKAIIL